MKSVSLKYATAEHVVHAHDICQLIEKAAQARGTGIAKRKPEYIEAKLANGNAVIALDGSTVAGFCYIETWEHMKYVAHSGLVVNPEYRHQGLAKKIKAKAFKLSRKLYPDSKVFGLTTSLAVMKINSDLGYKPVTFSELTEDEEFWKGCSSCKNYDILQRTERKHCLCNGMLFDPKEKGEKRKKKAEERWQNMKSIVKKIKSNEK